MRKKRGNVTELKVIKVMVAILLILSLTSGNFFLLGKEVVAMAISQDLDTQTADTINKNVKFDTFFKNDNGNNTHYLVYDVNGNLEDMYMNLSVKDGYLKNASIEFADQNYSIQNIVDEGQMLQEATNEKLSLKQVNTNTDISLQARIGSIIGETMKIDDIQKESKVILKGTYVDNLGKENPIEKEVKICVGLKQDVQAELTQELASYFSFKNNGEDKFLVRISAKVSLGKQENNLPRKETQLTIQVPTLNGIAPESVNVLPKNTSMTNGEQEEKIVYSNSQVNYDKDKKIVTMTVENKETDQKLWSGNGQDEYIISYVYPREAITAETNKFVSKAEANITMYQAENEKEVKANNQVEITLDKEVGTPLTLEMTAEDSMNKGKMYANSQRELKEYDTEYNTEWKIDVTNKDMTDAIRIVSGNSYFTNQAENIYSLSIGSDNYSNYKETKVNKENFERILGQDGYINISDEKGNTISSINKNTKQDEEGNLIVSYPDKTGRIILETSKPVSEGILYVKHNKKINADLPYSKEQLKSFIKLNETVQLNQKQANNYNNMGETKAEIVLTETNTNANIVLNKDILSTIVTNENVEMKIELDNNRKDTDLYVNPTFFVELPEYIEDINVKEANVLFDDNLQIQEVKKLTQDGKIILQITLQGMQDGFSLGSFTNGTNIVLTTDIKAKLLTPNKSDEIKLYYTNPNAISYANIGTIGEQSLGETSTDIQFSAPAGMLAVSSITNYESTGKNVISVKQGTITDKISIFDNAKTAKMQVMIVNNTGNSCNSVVALGRIPFKGNKNIESDTNLGTTLDTVLKSKLTADGIDEDKVEIYYSEKEEASKDLNNTANAWTKEPEDLSKIKSYLIVLKDYEMPTGQTLKFNYDFEIPANLEHENSLYGAFGVYFTNKTNTGDKEEKVVADIVGLTTGQGPKLAVDQAVSVGDGNPVQEGQTVKITVKVSNTGSSDIENVYVKDYIPNYTRYTEYQEGSGDYGEIQSGYIYPETKQDTDGRDYIDWNIGTIKVGESVTKEFEVYVNKLPSLIEYYQETEGFRYDETTNKYYLDEVNEDGQVTSSKEVSDIPEQKLINEVSISAKDLEKNLTNQSKGNPIEKTYFDIIERSSIDKNTKIREKDEIVYYIDIINTSEQKLTGVTAEKILPVGIDYKYAYVLTYDDESDKWENENAAKYDKETGKIVWSIGELNSQATKRIALTATASTLEDGKYEQEIKTKTTVYADDVGKHVSSETINTVAKPHIETKISSDATKQYITEGDKITYTINIKNVGKFVANNLKVEDVLPAELKFSKGNYTINSKTEGTLKAYDNKVTLTINLQPDEDVVFNIVAQAKNLPNNLDEKEIKNYATISGDNIETMQTETLTNIIEQSPDLPNPPDNNNNTNNGNNGNNGSNSGITEKYFKIRGVAWVDANANGAREQSEQVLGGIRVILVNASNGEFIKDKDSGELKQTTTANDGSYVFENLDKGEYMVVFYYNNQIYGVTDYKKSGVSENQNSDVIASKITENGVQTEVAITDTIRITNSSVANIDMGLVLNKKFDLKLDKFVSKITVQNKEGVKTYNYTDSTMAKVDITAKRMVGSTIVVEYKIKVTNEGNIAGYAKNIVDYLPKELKFNSDLNSTWYAGNDGYLYNTELAEQVINPGETKEISLILTKQISDSSSVIVNNLAEIYEDYNELGIKDIDSNIRNQAQGEDDMGSANVLITIKTGSVVTYTCITLISLIILGAGIYVIRKKTARYYN